MVETYKGVNHLWHPFGTKLCYNQLFMQYRAHLSDIARDFDISLTFYSLPKWYYVFKIFKTKQKIKLRHEFPICILLKQCSRCLLPWTVKLIINNSLFWNFELQPMKDEITQHNQNNEHSGTIYLELSTLLWLLLLWNNVDGLCNKNGFGRYFCFMSPMFCVLF